MIQTEAQRQFYLGFAGIRLWYAREPLPGAAPSPEFRFPEPVEPAGQPVPGELPVATASTTANVAPPSSEASQRGIQRIASLQALMEGKTDPAPSKNEQKHRSLEALNQATDDTEESIESGSQAKRSVAQALNLSIGVFAGSRHTLIARISKEASLRLQETLAMNILSSLGEGQLAKPEWVHWPVFNNRLVPGSALNDLKSVMALVLEGSGDKKVIVLGSLELKTPDTDWLAGVLQRAPDVDFEHTLTELAGNPGLKRSLWEHLKSLAAT